MANNIAFQPMGNTAVIAVTATSSNVAVTASSPANQFMISNVGSNPAFISIGLTSAVAVVPTSGSPASGFCVPAGATKVVTSIQSNPTQTMYVAAIGTANTTVYVTPGEGL
jgi:hypothetical protein